MGPARIQDPRQGNLNVRVRSYRPTDADACHDVFVAAVRRGAAQFYTEAQRAAWAPSDLSDPDWADHLAAQHIWVAEADGALVGFMSVEEDGHLDLAFVRPEWMGRSVAQALHDRIVQWAQPRDLGQLRTEASHLARRFFARRGWRVIEPETVMFHGESLERFRMVLELKHKP